MKHLRIMRSKRMGYVLIVLLAIAAARTPVAQRIVLVGLVNFVDEMEMIVRLPCCLFDHTHCFTPDRFDPTCPQCI